MYHKGRVPMRTCAYKDVYLEGVRVRARARVPTGKGEGTDGTPIPLATRYP